MLKRFSSFSPPKEDKDKPARGPIIITIGPQNSGKTKYIRELGEKICEFSIDNVPFLYEKASLDVVKKVWTDKISGDVIFSLKAKQAFDVNLLDRLKQLKDSEQALVTLLFTKEISYRTFEEKIREKINDKAIEEEFLTAVVEILNDLNEEMKAQQIDIQVPEAIGKALAAATEDIKTAINSNPFIICWGNCNLNPTFYKDVLQFASTANRVVRFVRWGKELDRVPLGELYKRSILRYLKTGRYVDSLKVAKFYANADFIVKKAGEGHHEHYAALADYTMNETGLVLPKGSDLAAPRPKLLRRASTSSAGGGKNLGSSSTTQQDLTEYVNYKYGKWTNEGLVYNLALFASPPVVPRTNMDTVLSYASLNGGKYSTTSAPIETATSTSAAVNSDSTTTNSVPFQDSSNNDNNKEEVTELNKSESRERESAPAAVPPPARPALLQQTSVMFTSLFAPLVSTPAATTDESNNNTPNTATDNVVAPVSNSNSNKESVTSPPPAVTTTTTTTTTEAKDTAGIVPTTTNPAVSKSASQDSGSSATNSNAGYNGLLDTFARINPLAPRRASNTKPVSKSESQESKESRDKESVQGSIEPETAKAVSDKPVSPSAAATNGKKVSTKSMSRTGSGKPKLQARAPSTTIGIASANDKSQEKTCSVFPNIFCIQ